ncbi:MAG TPA: sulfite reductase subunit alpha [Verrucomicrobiae bacterium]|nr:sulfite reductase subunit alpha [Verrucomicrobiae bacterium]
MDANSLQSVPCLPENAPFTPEQRAYLNGFFAGLFSRTALPASPAASAPAPDALVPLAILFGSQTGNSENLARRAAKAAGQRGFAPTIQDLSKYPVEQLSSEQRLLVITSTYGDGEPPDNAKAFWEFLSNETAPKLPHLRFSLCALGDSNYPRFCAFGKQLDSRLEELGGTRVHPAAICDVEFEEPFSNWLACALAGLTTSVPAQQITRGPATPAQDSAAPTAIVPGAAYSRSNPFPAPLVGNQRLNGQGSEKDTRHLEFALDGSDFRYEAGDALGVFPSNCGQLVEELVTALHCRGNELVSGRDGATVTLREALGDQYEITRIPRPLIECMAEQTGDDALKRLAAPDANGELTTFLRGRDIIDLLQSYPTVKFDPAEFVRLLKPLAPRLYSISSSPKAHPAQVHLTINVVRYQSLSRHRKGVCSTYLAERVERVRQVPIFLHSNRKFRPPADGSPMVMVGPGTGIAPFRAFLQERRARGAAGKNWLFFGDQRSATDFLYREELEGLSKDGFLARLDTAFSRDQPEKIYVQHRMREQARELFKWLEEGAYFYVCGDAARMAKDVDATLHRDRSRRRRPHARASRRVRRAFKGAKPLPPRRVLRPRRGRRSEESSLKIRPATAQDKLRKP